MWCVGRCTWPVSVRGKEGGVGGGLGVGGGVVEGVTGGNGDGLYGFCHGFCRLTSPPGVFLGGGGEGCLLYIYFTTQT